jgi:hypothetical protein
MPSIVSGPEGSLVLVAGSFWLPAIAAGETVGAAAATGAVVGVTLEAAVAIGVDVGAGAGIAVALGATVNGGRVGGITKGADTHAVLRNLSLISVTLPFLASALPYTVTLSARVMEVKAMIVPTNVEPVPRAAELPICQKTLQGFAPLTRLT